MLLISISTMFPISGLTKGEKAAETNVSSVFFCFFFKKTVRLTKTPFKIEEEAFKKVHCEKVPL